MKKIFFLTLFIIFSSFVYAEVITIKNLPFFNEDPRQESREFSASYCVMTDMRCSLEGIESMGDYNLNDDSEICKQDQQSIYSIEYITSLECEWYSDGGDTCSPPVIFNDEEYNRFQASGYYCNKVQYCRPNDLGENSLPDQMFDLPVESITPPPIPMDFVGKFTILGIHDSNKLKFKGVFQSPLSSNQIRVSREVVLDFDQTSNPIEIIGFKDAYGQSLNKFLNENNGISCDSLIGLKNTQTNLPIEISGLGFETDQGEYDTVSPNKKIEIQISNLNFQFVDNYLITFSLINTGEVDIKIKDIFLHGSKNYVYEIIQGKDELFPEEEADYILKIKDCIQEENLKIKIKYKASNYVCFGEEIEKEITEDLDIELVSQDLYKIELDFSDDKSVEKKIDKLKVGEFSIINEDNIKVSINYYLTQCENEICRVPVKVYVENNGILTIKKLKVKYKK